MRALHRSPLRRRPSAAAALCAAALGGGDSDLDVLAKPIRWGEQDQEEQQQQQQRSRGPPSPKSLILATALVELKGEQRKASSCAATSGVEDEAVNLVIDEDAGGVGAGEEVGEAEEGQEQEDNCQPLNLSMSSPAVKTK